MSKITAGENSWAVTGPARASAARRTTAAAMRLRRSVMAGAPCGWVDIASSAPDDTLRAPVDTKVRIYMASPLGFSEAGRHFYDSVLVPHVRNLGYEVPDPWALTDRRAIEAVEKRPHGP